MNALKPKDKVNNKSRFSSIWLLVDILPILLPVIIATFGLVSVALLLFGQLTSTYAFSIGLAVSILASVFLIKSYSSLKIAGQKERRICNVIAIIGVLLWIGINLPFTSQHVFTNRDPGVYSVTSLHLVNKDNLQLKSSSVYSGIKDVSGNSGGFSADPRDTSKVAAQGAHLLPSLVGLTGRITSETAMLRLNLIFGAAALLAVYGFGRMLMKPRWALLATATFGLVFPLMYFSRDMYTEPLTAAFTFGGLSLLWLAFKSKYKSLWFFAGLVTGATVLTRIDGYLTIAGVIMSVFLYLILSSKQNRPSAIKNTVTILLGIIISATIGFLDIYQLSHSYLLSEWGNIKPELALIALTIIAGIVATVLSWRTNAISRVMSFGKKHGLKIFTVLLIVISIGLVSRPLWLVGYDQKPIINTTTNITEQVLQRDYSEITVNWLVWYIGPVAVLLAVVGLWLLVKKVIQKRQIEALPFLLIFGGVGLVYLINPSIFPDQIWASRRFLPVVMPGCILLAAYTLSWLFERGKTKLLGVESKSLALILVAPLLIGPLFVTASLYNTREAVWYGALEAVCHKTPKDSAVLWLGSARTQLVEPSKALCGVESEGYGSLFNGDDKITQATLAKAAAQARQKGYVPIIGLFGSEKALLPEAKSSEPATIYQYTNETIEQTNTRPPRLSNITSQTVVLGLISPDGKVLPLK